MSGFVQLEATTVDFLSKILNNLKSEILDDLKFTKESISEDLKKLKNVLDTLNKFNVSENMLFTLKGNWERIVFTSILKHLNEKNEDELTDIERNKLSPFFIEDLEEYKSKLTSDNNLEFVRLLSESVLQKRYEKITESCLSEYLEARKLFNIYLDAKEIMNKTEGNDLERMFEYRINLLLSIDFVKFLGDNTNKIRGVIKYILKKLIKNDEIKLDRENKKKKIEDEENKRKEEIEEYERSLGLI